MPQRSFASGGIVDAVDYRDIARRYNDRLTGLGGDADRARALALIAAGAGIMGGGSSNTLRNVGTGISAAVPMYQDRLQAIDTEELNLLRGITDIGQAQSQEELARMDRDFRERQLASEERRADERLTFEKTPADILKFRAYQEMTPEEQADYERLNPPYNPNTAANAAFGQDARAQAAFASVLSDVEKQLTGTDAWNNLPPDLQDRLFSKDPAIRAAAEEEKKRLIYEQAVARYKIIYPEFEAWAKVYEQIATTTPTTGAFASDAGAVNDKDPLGLGL